MGMEVERKFLVKGDFKQLADRSIHVLQGYLSTENERSVRVRIMDKKAYLTIKGMGNDSGVSRPEWEYEIPYNDAKELLQICEIGIIEKKRYIVFYEGYRYEVDEFFGKNEGLQVAELELKTEDEEFKKPGWLGREITDEMKYYNMMLLKHPFKYWVK